MTNIRPLRGNDLSPEIVLQNCLEIASDMKSCIVIMLPKNIENGPQIWATKANLGEIAVMSKEIQILCDRYFRGEVDDI